MWSGNCAVARCTDDELPYALHIDYERKKRTRLIYFFSLAQFGGGRVLLQRPSKTGMFLESVQGLYSQRVSGGAPDPWRIPEKWDSSRPAPWPRPASRPVPGLTSSERRDTGTSPLRHDTSGASFLDLVIDTSCKTDTIAPHMAQASLSTSSGLTFSVCSFAIYRTSCT